MMDWEAHPLSFSQIKVAKRCLWRYNQEYNLGIRRRTKRSIIAEGAFIHRLLASMAMGARGSMMTWRELWAAIKGEYENAALFEEEADQIGDLSGRVFNIVERYEAQAWLPFFSQGKSVV